MKHFTPEWQAALEAGDVVSHGAVRFNTSEGVVAVWSGYGTLDIADEPYLGIGKNALVKTSGGQIGGSTTPITLELSGVGEGQLEFDANLLRNAPVMVWRLGFNKSGSRCLDATRYDRGRVHGFSKEDVIGGTSTLRLTVMGAAAAAGRFLARMRSDADQRLIAPNDDGFRATASAPTKDFMWGGYPPERGTVALGGSTGLINQVVGMANSRAASGAR